MRSSWRLIVTPFIIVYLSSVAMAQTPPDKTKGPFPTGVHSKLGVKFGGIGPSSVLAVGSPTLDTRRSFSEGIFLEERGPKHLQFGVAFDSYDVYPVNGQLDRKPIWCGSVEARYRFARRISRLDLRPGAGFGVAFSDLSGYSDNSQFLTCKFFGEAIYHTLSEHGVVFELGVIFAPTGRSSRTHGTVTFGPIFLYRMGVFW